MGRLINGFGAISVRSLRPTCGLGSLVALSCWLLFAGAASAEVRMLEVVGAVPLDERTRGKAIPKDAAIEEALWEGVSRVAGDLLVDSLVPEPEDGSDPIRAALGDDMVPFTKSFRIVDDQGERPALFTEHPDAATEYVVVVEVHVEVNRVRDRLVSAGLLEGEHHNALSGIQLEIRELDQYGGYAELMDLLVGERVGAASATPVEMARGHTVLNVQAEWGPKELLERLLAAAPPELRITPVDVQEARTDPVWGGSEAPARLVIGVAWTPPPAEDGLEGASRRGPGVRRAGATRGDRR